MLYDILDDVMFSVFVFFWLYYILFINGGYSSVAKESGGLYYRHLSVPVEFHICSLITYIKTEGL